MPEVDEQTLALLQRSHQLLQQLNGDPRTRDTLETALKVHYPAVTTEAEARNRLVQPMLDQFQEQVVKPLQERLDAADAARTASESTRAETALNEAFSEFRTKRGFTDEGIEAVKRLMVDRSIADPYAAAALFAEQNPTAPERDAMTGFSPPQWDLEQTLTQVDVKGLFENEDAWADKQAANVLNEIRVGQAA